LTSLPRAMPYMMEEENKETMGIIQKTRPMAFLFWFFCPGSLVVIHRQNQCVASRIRGIANTAKALELQPSGWLSTPQWVVITSGSWFQSKSPTIMGSRISTELTINLVLFWFSIVILLSDP